jgi:integrase
LSAQPFGEDGSPLGTKTDGNGGCLAGSIRYVDVAEYRKLMDAAKNIWWKAVISLAYGNGLRRNEILNLTWSDVDFEKQMIHVRAKQESIETIEWEPRKESRANVK